MIVSVPSLATERLTLRGWREGDFDGYSVLMSEERTKFVGGPISREESWRKMASIAGHWLLRGYGTFVIELRADASFCGYCGPWFPYGFPEPEIGWAVSAAAEGKGIATEAARVALHHAFQTLGWQTAVSFIAIDNTGSIRVAERLGAYLDGTTEIRGKMCQVWRHPASLHLQQTQH